MVFHGSRTTCCVHVDFDHLHIRLNARTSSTVLNLWTRGDRGELKPARDEYSSFPLLYQYPAG